MKINMNGLINSAIKRALQKRGEIMQHKMCRSETASLLKNIESENGALNPKFKKMALEYAQDVLGSKHYAPWLNVYAAMTGDFIEGWIPENYFSSVVIPNTQGLYGKVSFAKSLSRKFLNTDRLPDIAYYVNGLFFSLSWEILPPEEVENYIFSHNDKVVYKQDISLRGLGIRFFTKETFDMEEIRKIGNGVFQKYIRQHGFFEEILPNIVATLRLTSVINNKGEASCRSAFLRLGRQDSTHCKWATDTKIPVDLKTGKLYEKGYSLEMKSTNCHPDTKVFFKGKIIPKFEECLNYVEKTHKTVSYCRMVGWDLIVNENEEIQLMEWNGYFNDITFAEATQGPCFADMGWEKIWKEKK